MGEMFHRLSQELKERTTVVGPRKKEDVGLNESLRNLLCAYIFEGKRRTKKRKTLSPTSMSRARVANLLDDTVHQSIRNRDRKVVLRDPPIPA